jgi:hypothetical protein
MMNYSFEILGKLSSVTVAFNLFVTNLIIFFHEKFFYYNSWIAGLSG